MLWVPSYAHTEPMLGGVPFFYWYQALWVMATPALMTAAHLMLHYGRSDGVNGTAS